jgi:hypothetical protein
VDDDSKKGQGKRWIKCEKEIDFGATILCSSAITGKHEFGTIILAVRLIT